MLYYILNVISQHTAKHTHKTMDADTLAIVDTSDGGNDIIQEGLWESFSYHGFFQSLIHQGKKTITTHCM